MSGQPTVCELTVLLQDKVIEDKGDDTILHEVYKTRAIRLDAANLLAKIGELHQAENPDEGISLPILDQCEQCQSSLSLLIDEAITSNEHDLIFCTANIYCENCSPSVKSPTFIITTVFDRDGSAVECECINCEDCRGVAVIWLEGAVLCWPCIKKHNLKKAIMYDDSF